MPKIKNIPIGTVDTDTDPRYLQPGDVTLSKDMYSGDGSGVDGARVPMVGNVNYFPISYTNNANVVGSVENKQRGEGIFFVNQSLLEDFIYIMNPVTGPRILSCKGKFLGFGNRIHSAAIVDGKYLYWTDGFTDKDSITGNPLRKLDLDRADDKFKKFRYEILFGGAFVDGTRYRIDFYDIDFNPIIDFSFVVTGVAGDKKAGLELIKGWLDTITLGSTLTVVNNGCSLEVEVDTAEVRIWITSHFSGVPAENGNDVLTLFDNHYVFAGSNEMLGLIFTDEHKEFMISRVPYQPQFAPTHVFGTDASNSNNYMDRIVPQFTYRYIFWDGSKSAWSAYSLTTIPSDGQNYATITFSDDWLSSPATLSLITHIELAVRYGNTDTFKSIEKIRICDLDVSFNSLGGPTSYDYDWYNDSIYTEVASDDDGEGQVLKLFDHCPRLSGAIAQVSDEYGITRIIDSAIMDGFDLPVVDVDIESFDTNIDDGLYKKVSRFGLGVVYADRTGRRTTVSPIGDYRTRDWFYEGYAAKMYPRLSINSLPPSWASHYYIVRTKNRDHQRWKPAFSIPDSSITNILVTPNIQPHVEFGSMGSNEEGFVPSAFGAPETTHLRFRILSPFLDGDLSNETLVNFESNDAAWFFQPSIGDRFRVIARVDALNAFVLDDFDADYEVTGYEYEIRDDYFPTSDPDYRVHWLYVYAKVTGGTPDYTLFPDDGWLLEVYSPKQVEDELYYEVYGGEIINGFHQADFQDQTASQPAIARLFGTGDAYRRGDVVPKYRHLPAMIGMEVEVESPFLFVDSKVEPIGKPNIEDPTYGEKFYRNRHRASDTFIPDSQINGLGSFRAINYIHTDQSFGIVKKTAMVHNVLLAIHEFKAQPIYVSKDRFLQMDGETIGRSSRLLNIGDESVMDWGTQNPESVVVDDGRAYAFDRYRGTWWMYTSQGIENIGGGRKKFFKDYSLLDGHNEIIGGIDRFRGIVFLTFDVLRNETTFGYSIGKNGQEGDFSFLPECYLSIGDRMYVFQDGQVWEHGGVLNVPCNYFGTQYTPNVTIPLSKDNAVNSQQVKVFKNLRVFCPQQKMILPDNGSITIPAYPGVPSGMASRLKAGKFELYEGEWFADFLRDLNTPDISNPVIYGRPLRGHIILCKFEPETPSQYFEFHFCEVEYYLS